VRFGAVTFTNFRCFEHLELEFVEGVNAVIGPNGAGKSAVLDGLACVMFATLAKGGVQPGLTWTPSQDDVRYTTTPTDSDIRFTQHFPMEISGTVVDEARLRKFPNDLALHLPPLTIRSTLSGSAMPPSSSASNDFDCPALFRDGQSLPLLVYLPAYRACKHSSELLEIGSAMSTSAERVSAYECAADAASVQDRWVEWVARQELISLQEGKHTSGFAILQEAVRRCLPGASSVEFNIRERTLVVRFGDNRFRLDSLSDGQRAILAIVIDLTRRAVLLNDHLGDAVLDEADGVVLIDEIDLHLHPTWQRQIIGSLTTSFPKVQFIVTTHSPQVIGELDPPSIISLGSNVDEISASKGMDSNWILKHVMGSTEQSPETAAELDRIKDLIESGDLAAARQQTTDLVSTLGPSVQLQRLRTRIDRLELLRR
jgi:predicted ATP-binding protein involved in virulence